MLGCKPCFLKGIVMAQPATSNIKAIKIEDDTAGVIPSPMDKERTQAIETLLSHNDFRPVNDDAGPYEITLSIQDHRLVIYMKNAEERDLSTLVLALKPYKRIVQDYFLMIESYEQAREYATPEKLEAIDMGRRGLHNEGAELLQRRLEDKIKMDMETARRFFTLICVLHKAHLRAVC